MPARGTGQSRSITNSHVGRIVFDGAGGIGGVEANTNNGATVVYNFTGIFGGHRLTSTGALALSGGLTSQFDAAL
jgi:hypothetical protein